MPQTTPACNTLPLVTIEPRTLAHLIQAFERLSQPNNTLERLSAETEKLLIIEALETIILQETHRYIPPLPRAEQHWQDALEQRGREILYYFLLLLGMIQNAATSYLFWLDLFSLMPALSNPIVIFLSVCSMILASGLFYSFEVTFLHDAIGINGSNTELSQILELYSKQLNTARDINQRLASMHMLPIEHEQYDGYLELIGLINQDLQVKHASMGHYPESTLKQVLKAIALTFGAFSSAAGSYVATQSLLTTFASCWVGTPIGWGLILTAIVVDLGFYYAMGATSTARLINPEFDHYQTLKKELALFQTTYPEELHTVRNIKHRFFERKPMQDASTQTDEGLNPVIH